MMAGQKEKYGMIRDGEREICLCKMVGLDEFLHHQQDNEDFHLFEKFTTAKVMSFITGLPYILKVHLRTIYLLKFVESWLSYRPHGEKGN